MATNAPQLTPQGRALLEVEQVTMRFGGLTAVNALSFQARKGDITALIGPNGAGKTTVFNCITGFYKPTQGMVSLNHDDGSSYLLERMPAGMAMDGTTATPSPASTRPIMVVPCWVSYRLCGCSVMPARA